MFAFVNDCVYYPQRALSGAHTSFRTEITPMRFSAKMARHLYLDCRTQQGPCAAIVSVATISTLHPYLWKTSDTSGRHPMQAIGKFKDVKHCVKRPLTAKFFFSEQSPLELNIVQRSVHHCRVIHGPHRMVGYIISVLPIDVTQSLDSCQDLEAADDNLHPSK